MIWNLKRKGLKGVTADWGMSLVLVDIEGKMFPKEADRIIHGEFYAYGNEWPICPITKKKIPLA